jgi:autotransporter-associated beta strand protein
MTRIFYKQNPASRAFTCFAGKLLCLLSFFLLSIAAANAQLSTANWDGSAIGAAGGIKGKPTPTPTPPPVDAQIVWNNTGSDFNSTGSWTGGVVPTSADVAAFTASVSNLTVNLSSNSGGVGTIAGLYFKGTGSINYDITSSSTSIKFTLSGTSTSNGAILAEDSVANANAIRADNTSGTNTIDAPIILGGAAATSQAFVQARGGTLVINGVISSTNSITGFVLLNNSTTGSATFTFAGANTYSGSTTIFSNDILNINNAAAISSGALILSGSATIDNTSGGAITLTNNNPVTLQGGSLTFTGTNNLNLGTGAFTISGSNRSVTVSAGTLTIGGVVSQDLAGRVLQKLGAGTLTLSGSNVGGSAFTGGVRLSGGTLNINNANALGTGTFNIDAGTPTIDNTSGGAITLATNNAITLGSNITFTGTNDLNLGTGAVTLSGANRQITVSAGTLTIGGAIGQDVAGRGLTKLGAGTLILSNSNTYTGNTGVSAGTLSINTIKNLSTSSAIGAPTTTAAGTIAIGSTTTGATLNYTGTGDSTNRVIDLAGTTGGATLDQSGTGTLTFTSDFTATGVGAKTLTLQGSNSGDGVINGKIVDSSGGGATSLVKAGTGTWTLAGLNTYSGGTTLSAGLLQLKSTSALGSSSGSLTVNGGILDLNGQNISVGNLTGSAGTIWNNGPLAGSSTVTLTIGTSNTGGGTYAGVIQDNNGAAPLAKVALTKTGTGTITLSGANLYTGATNVNGGTLFINGDQTSATGLTTVTNSGSVLGGTGTIGGGVTLASSGTILEAGTGSTGQTLTIKGALTQSTTGSILELALGASGAHSTLALTAAGSSSFYLTQHFNFIDVGATTSAPYNSIITGVTSAVVTTGWQIDNAGWSGTFVWNATSNAIDLNLIAVPEPGTYFAGALTLLALGYTQRKRFGRVLKKA